MAKFSNLIGTNQIADNAVTEVELAVALQSKITQITTNQAAIAAIVASKAVANGIATLGASVSADTHQLSLEERIAILNQQESALQAAYIEVSNAIE